MIKIRVEGEPKEVEKFVRLLEKKDVRVLSESDDYKNRNSVYVRKINGKEKSSDISNHLHMRICASFVPYSRRHTNSHVRQPILQIKNS